MLRLTRVIVLGGLAGLLLAACSPTPTDSGSSGPSVAFVGNDTCPTTARGGNPAPAPYDPSPPRTNGPAVGQAIEEMPHDHVAQGVKVKYTHDPPTSGCHYNLGSGTAPITAGAYDQAIGPEYWAHNLEHGYVAILYNCPQKCDSEFSQLRAWSKTLGADPGGGVPYAKIIVLPETTMAVKFACVSWDWYLGMQSLDMQQVTAFYNNHINQAPEGAATA